MPFQNPYPEGSFGKANEHRVSGRVDTNDYYYVKRLFPAHTGITDKIVSNLFKLLVDEIKSYGLDDRNTNHQAWHTEHPNHTLPERIIKSIRFERVAGGFVGHSGARDVGRTVEGIREEVQSTAAVGADKKGGARKGGSRKTRSKTEGDKKG